MGFHGRCAFIRYGISLLEMTRSQTAQFMMIASYYRKKVQLHLDCRAHWIVSISFAEVFHGSYGYAYIYIYIS